MTHQSFDQLRKGILECLDASKFNEISQYTDQILKFSSKHTNDYLFQLGVKVLSTIANLKQASQLVAASTKLFEKWFDFCVSLNHKQNKYIIRYCVMLVRALANNKLNQLVFYYLEKLQNHFLFPCDNKNDSDALSHIKYLAPLTYNQAIDKDLMNNDIATTIDLFVHATKLYLKLSSNFYVLLNTLRVIETSLLRTSSPPRLFESLYEPLLRFLAKSVNCSIDWTSSASSDVSFSVAFNQHVSKQINIRKFFLAVYLHLLKFSYSNREELGDQSALIEKYLPCLRTCFDKDFREIIDKVKIPEDPEGQDFGHHKSVATIGKPAGPIESTRPTDFFRLGVKALEVYDTIHSYLDAVDPDSSSKSKSSSSSSTSRRSSSAEHQLHTKFVELHNMCVERDCHYHYWILNSLLEVFVDRLPISALIAYVSSASRTDSSVSNVVTTYARIAIIYADNCRSLYVSNHYSYENISKSILFQPVYFTSSVSKIIESILQKCNQTKTPIPENVLERAESLWKHQFSYLKWLTSIFNHEEHLKLYNTFELMIMRAISQLYVLTKSEQNFNIQMLGVEITAERISYQSRTNHRTTDSNQCRNFRHIVEHFLSTLRCEEKFDQAQKVLKKAHEYLIRLGLDASEIEFIVVSWCKIKRDMARQKNTDLKSTTVVDFLSIPHSSPQVLQYLFEEFKTYNSFRSETAVNHMLDDMFQCLVKLESFSADEPLLKARIYLEIAQFKLNDSENAYKDSFKLSSEEYMDKAEKYLNQHKNCPKSLNLDIPIENENPKSKSSKSRAGTKTTKSSKDQETITKGKGKRLSNSPPPFDSPSPMDTTPKQQLKSKAAATTGKRRRVKIGGTTKSPLNKTPSNLMVISPDTSQESTQQRRLPAQPTCSCVSYQIVRFQINFLKFLCTYAKMRQKQLDEMTQIIDARMKIKVSTVTLTNADSLNLNPAGNNIENYLCSEFKNQSTTNYTVGQQPGGSGVNDTIVIDDSFDSNASGSSHQQQQQLRDGTAILMELLDRCADSIDNIASCLDESSSSNGADFEFSREEKSLVKQFLDSLELLAHVYGFFRCNEKRTSVLEQLVKIARRLVGSRNAIDEVKTKNSTGKVDNVYAIACVDLMRAYVESHRCDLFEIFVNDMFGVMPSINLNESASDKTPLIVGTDLTNKPATTSKRTAKSSSTKTSSSSSSSSSKSIDSYVDKVIAAYDANKTLNSKPNVTFYLIFTHYLILRHKCAEAIKLIKEKILGSDVVNGKQTAIYYETRAYLKYLEFLLSMTNLESKLENDFMEMIDNETPLSLLDDCYCASYSVTRFYVESSIEPTRVITNSLMNEAKPPVSYGQIFFDISHADHYRTMNQFFDVLNVICKFYIDISRYRDSTGYLREAFDISQIHYLKKQVAQCMLLQIYSDIIAESLSEATSRIELASRLIPITSDAELDACSDMFDARNYLQLVYLKFLIEVKQHSLNQSSTSSSAATIILPSSASAKRALEEAKSNVNAKMTLVRRLSGRPMHDYCKEIIIDILLLSCESLLKHDAGRSSSTTTTSSSIRSLIQEVFKLLNIELLGTSPDCVTSLREKWQLAEYYYNLFEAARSADSLALAYKHMRKNPAPLLYRRICMKLFNNETDTAKRIMHLFETQSIALRHKACSIQLKQKRKALANPKIFDILMSTISFDCVEANTYLTHFVERILPSDCICVSLMLDRDTDHLYLIRLEKGLEPLLIKLDYKHRFSDEFRQMMTDNDSSMKQSDRRKFWHLRNDLNRGLIKFLNDLETNVFGRYRMLLLGSFGEDEKPEQTAIGDFKKRFGSSVSLNSERLLCLKIIMLGLDQLTPEQIQAELKQNFESTHVVEMEKWFSDVLRPRLVCKKRKHVCLIVDKYLHQIPWESMNVTINQTISRMPSLHFLYSHIQINTLTIDKDNAFYIVDPGNDLTHTRAKFQPFFEQMKSWKGLVGVPPNEAQFKKALTEHELFIYTGHGSGSQYYPSEDVQKLRIQACSILMGCSSGNQYVLGEFEPHGTVLAYILAGCPCIVGNLWDVTDRDIDKLTEEFLQSWINEHESNNNETSSTTTSSSSDNSNPSMPSVSSSTTTTTSTSLNPSNICNHLIRARKACKLAYLNGSAPIVYGLPVKFKNSNKNE